MRYRDGAQRPLVSPIAKSPATTFFNFHEPDHKYDQWAVGRRFARRYAAVE